MHGVYRFLKLKDAWRISVFEIKDAWRISVFEIKDARCLSVFEIKHDIEAGISTGI